MTSTSARQATPQQRDTENVRTHRIDAAQTSAEGDYYAKLRYRDGKRKGLTLEEQALLAIISNIAGQHSQAIERGDRKAARFYAKPLWCMTDLARQFGSEGDRWAADRIVNALIEKGEVVRSKDKLLSIPSEPPNREISHDSWMPLREISHDLAIQKCEISHDSSRQNREISHAPLRKKSSKKEKRETNFLPSVSTDGRTDDSSFSSDSIQEPQEPGSEGIRASDEAKPDISPDQPPDAPQTISEHGRVVLSQLIQNQEIVNELLADWPRITAVGDEQRFLLAVARAPKLVMQADSPGGYVRKVMRDPLGLDDPGAKKRFDRADSLAKCKIASQAARDRRERTKAKVTPQQRIDANLAEMDALEFQAPGFLALCRDQSEQSDCRELFEHPDCPSMAFAAAEEIDKVAGRSKAKPKSIDPQILLDSMLNRLAALIDGNVIEPVTVSEPDPAPEMVDPKPRAAKPSTSSHVPKERFRSTFNAMLSGFRQGHAASVN